MPLSRKHVGTIIRSDDFAVTADYRLGVCVENAEGDYEFRVFASDGAEIASLRREILGRGLIQRPTDGEIFAVDRDRRMVKYNRETGNFDFFATRNPILDFRTDVIGSGNLGGHMAYFPVGLTNRIVFYKLSPYEAKLFDTADGSEVENLGAGSSLGRTGFDRHEPIFPNVNDDGTADGNNIWIVDSTGNNVFDTKFAESIRSASGHLIVGLGTVHQTISNLRSVGMYAPGKIVGFENDVDEIQFFSREGNSGDFEKTGSIDAPGALTGISDYDGLRSSIVRWNVSSGGVPGVRIEGLLLDLATDLPTTSTIPDNEGNPVRFTVPGRRTIVLETRQQADLFDVLSGASFSFLGEVFHLYGVSSLGAGRSLITLLTSESTSADPVVPVVPVTPTEPAAPVRNPVAYYWGKEQNERWPRNFPNTDNGEGIRRLAFQQLTNGILNESYDDPDNFFGDIFIEHDAVSSDIDSGSPPLDVDNPRQVFSLPAGRYNFQISMEADGANLVSGEVVCYLKQVQANPDKVILEDTHRISGAEGHPTFHFEAKDVVLDGTEQLYLAAFNLTDAAISSGDDVNTKHYMRIELVEAAADDDEDT